MSMKDTVTSITELQDWLADQLRNTAETPYTVALNVRYLRGDVSTPGSLGYVLKANKTKYVNLDLSGSTNTGITDNAFTGCTGLTGITIPASVTGIGEEAFTGCTSLAGITIPASVTSIGVGAFSDCTNLTDITIPESVTRIGDYAFSSCSSLAGVTIPASVTGIGDHTFSSCSSLAAVTIPAGVTGIGERAFSRCRNLTGIIIPAGVTGIGEEAFNRCESLVSVTFGGKIAAAYFNRSAFTGNLYDVFYAADPANGTPGTYTAARDNNSEKPRILWTKK